MAKLNVYLFVYSRHKTRRKRELTGPVETLK